MYKYPKLCLVPISILTNSKKKKRERGMYIITWCFNDNQTMDRLNRNNISGALSTAFQF